MLRATAASTGPGVFEAERRSRRFNWSCERVAGAVESLVFSGRDAGGNSDGTTLLVLADEGYCADVIVGPPIEVSCGVL